MRRLVSSPMCLEDIFFRRIGAHRLLSGFNQLCLLTASKSSKYSIVLHIAVTVVGIASWGKAYVVGSSTSIDEYQFLSTVADLQFSECGGNTSPMVYCTGHWSLLIDDGWNFWVFPWLSLFFSGFGAFLSFFSVLEWLMCRYTWADEGVDVSPGESLPTAPSQAPDEDQVSTDHDDGVTRDLVDATEAKMENNVDDDSSLALGGKQKPTKRCSDKLRTRC